MKTLCLLGIFTAGSMCGSGAQSAKRATPGTTTKPYVANEKAVAAVGALKKLKAKVEIGVSPSEYRSALGDVQYAVNEYLEDPSAKTTPVLDSRLKDALDAYTFADMFWRAQIIVGDEFPACSDEGREICAKYPEAVARYSGSSSLVVVFLPTCREASWEIASRSVGDAGALLTAGEANRQQGLAPDANPSVEAQIRKQITTLMQKKSQM